MATNPDPDGWVRLQDEETANVDPDGWERLPDTPNPAPQQAAPPQEGDRQIFERAARAGMIEGVQAPGPTMPEELQRNLEALIGDRNTSLDQIYQNVPEEFLTEQNRSAIEYYKNLHDQGNPVPVSFVNEQNDQQWSNYYDQRFAEFDHGAMSALREQLSRGLFERAVDSARDEFMEFSPMAALGRALSTYDPTLSDPEEVERLGYSGSVDARRERTTERSRANREEIAQQEALDPAWQEGGDLLDNIARVGSTFAGGAVGGSAGDPTALAGPGRTLVGRALAQIPIGGGVDAVTQGVEMAQGVRDEYDPIQTAFTAAGSAAFQAGAEGLGRGLENLVNWTETRRAENRFSAFTPERVARMGGNVETLGRPADKQLVEEIVADVTKNWQNTPETRVVDRLEDLPREEYDAIVGDGADNARGFYDRKTGQVTLIAENFRNPDEIMPAIFHESLGHGGLDREFGAGLESMLDDIYTRNKTVKEEIDSRLEQKPEANKYIEIEEYLAETSEGGVIDPKMMDRMSNWIRKFGREKMGLELDLSNAEVREILSTAHKNIVEGGENRAVSRGDRRYVQGPDRVKFTPNETEDVQLTKTLQERFDPIPNEGSTYTTDGFVADLSPVAERNGMLFRKFRIEDAEIEGDFLEGEMMFDETSGVWMPYWLERDGKGPVPDELQSDEAMLKDVYQMLYGTERSKGMLPEPNALEIRDARVNLLTRDDSDIRYSMGDDERYSRPLTQRQRDDLQRKSFRMTLENRRRFDDDRRQADPSNYAPRPLTERRKDELRRKSYQKTLESKLPFEERDIAERRYMKDPNRKPSKIAPNMKQKGTVRNINMNRLSAKQNIEDVAHKIVNNPDYLGFFEPGTDGPRTLQEIDDAARDLGMSASELSKLGPGMSPVEQQALRISMVSELQRAGRLTKKIRSGQITDLDLMNYEDALMTASALMRADSEQAAYLGLAMVARKIVAQTARPDEVRFIGEFGINPDGSPRMDPKDMTPEQRKRWRESVQDRAEKHGEILEEGESSAADALRSITEKSWMENLHTFRYHMMLSSIKTHAANIVGTASHVGMDMSAKMLGAGIGAIRAVTPAGRASDRMTFGEVFERHKGMLDAIRDSRTWRDAGNAYREGVPSHRVSKIENQQMIGDGPVSRVLEAPLRALAAEDEAWRGILLRSSAYGLTYRQATREGLRGDAHKARVDELRGYLEAAPRMLSQTDVSRTQKFRATTDIPQNMPLEFIHRGMLEANRMGLTEDAEIRNYVKERAEELNKAYREIPDDDRQMVKGIAREGINYTELMQFLADDPVDQLNRFEKWRHTNPSQNTSTKVAANIVRFAVPFHRTLLNLFRAAARNTPGTSLLSTRNWGGLREGGAARDEAIGRLLLAHSMIPMFYSAVEAGIITGSGPEDYEEAGNQQMGDWRPRSIRIGDNWVSYDGLEPLSIVLDTLATGYERSEDMGDLVPATVKAFIGAATENTFLQSVSDFMSLIIPNEQTMSWEERIGNYAGSVASSFWPNIVNDFFGAEYASDSTGDDSGMDRFQGRIISRMGGVADMVGLDLPTRYDMLGRPVERYGRFTVDEGETDPVAIEVGRLEGLSEGTLVAHVNSNFAPKLAYEPEAGEIQNFARVAGGVLRHNLEQYMQMPGYEELSDTDKSSLVKELWTDAKRDARMALYPGYYEDGFDGGLTPVDDQDQWERIGD